MLFNSWLFPPFLLVVLALYRFLPNRSQNAMLLLASYFFYAWWDVRFLLLVGATTLLDYSIGVLLERSDAAADPPGRSAAELMACYRAKERAEHS